MTIFATFSISRETTKILVANRINEKVGFQNLFQKFLSSNFGFQGKELTYVIKQEVIAEKNKMIKSDLEELLQTVATFPIQITLNGFVVLENSLILGVSLEHF